MQRKQVGIYIHIPFCVSKCKYCDFLSFTMTDEVKEKYVNALIREIKGYNKADECEVVSIFIGGGTPTVLDTKHLQSIINAVYNQFNVSEKVEFTIECNPKTANADKLLALRNAGVNRLSLGVQSMDDSLLSVLGRVHDTNAVYETFEMARSAGFSNINMDLMFALPGQTIKNWQDTLDAVINLRPEHISAYSLIIEPDTKFYDLYQEALNKKEAGKHQALLPSEDEELEMYDLAKQMLENAGYNRYEVSNFALGNNECIHNDGYWLRRDYIGFGLGAASLIDEARYENTTDLSTYLEISASIWENNFSSTERLSIEDAMSETMFLGLRRSKGVSKSAFKKKFNCDVMDVYGSVIEKQCKEGFLCIEEDNIYFSDKGNNISNVCLAEYLLD